MKKHTEIVLLIALLLIVATLPFLPFGRWDLTAEKRFSIAPQSKTIVSNLTDNVKVTFYSGGNIDANFARLNHAAAELLDELNHYAKTHISYQFVDPSDAETDTQRQKNYFDLEQRGLRGMSVAQRDERGGLTQQIVFPWAEIATSNDTMAICLLQPDGSSRGEEGVNRAIENLEYELIDAIRIVTKRTTDKIAFIEGHGELSEAEVYSACEAFSRYFQIDRGQIGTDADVLNDYRAIVVAKPTEPFSETEKYIIDQYIMHGGCVLWLLDGTQMQDQALSRSSNATLIPLDVNLTDQLFGYGVRICNTVLQDLQCGYTLINIAKPNEQPQFEPVAWPFAPLLLTSPQSPITRNVPQVRADFASTLEFTNNADPLIHKEILLISSNATHVSQTPAVVDLAQVMADGQNETYWHTAFQPVAALMEGQFASIFPSRGRPRPAEITSSRPHRDRSLTARMIVVSDGDAIRNDLEQTPQGVRVVPLGYDRATHRTYGNRDFLLNALLYLTDEQGLMSLRNRHVALRLLNQAATGHSRTLWQTINILVPIGLLALVSAAYFAIRRKKYCKNCRKTTEK